MRVLSFDVGIRHLAYADIEVGEGGGLALRGWEVIDVHEGRGVVKGIEAQTDALIDALDRRFYGPEAPAYDVVLVENQPAVKNPVMKTVQMTLYSYFSFMKRYTGSVGAVRLVSATRKLSGATHTAPSAPAPAPPATAPATTASTAAKGGLYRARKAEAVAVCRRFLEDRLCDAAALSVFDAAKKKDDLADCFLQGLWYIEKNAPPGARPSTEAAAESVGSTAAAAAMGESPVVQNLGLAAQSLAATVASLMASNDALRTENVSLSHKLVALQQQADVTRDDATEESDSTLTRFTHATWGRESGGTFAGTFVAQFMLILGMFMLLMVFCGGSFGAPKIAQSAMGACPFFPF